MREVNQWDPYNESRLLLRKSVWTGMVFSLAVVLCALNVFPPASVHYRVQSEIVVSDANLSNMQRSANPGELAPSASAALLKLEVLDRSTSDGNPARRADLVLVKLESLWKVRCSEDEHRSWVQSIAADTTDQVDQTGTGREHRLALWELEAAKHYAARHDFLNAEVSAGPHSASNSPFELASATLSSDSSAAGNSLTEDGSEMFASVRDELDDRIERAEALVAQTELARLHSIEQSSSMIEIADQPLIEAQANAIPAWLTFSVLVLGIASGLVGGWISYRLQSGGAHEPELVAHRLAIEGMPLVETLPIENDAYGTKRWISDAALRAQTASRRAGRNLVRISEAALCAWAILIVVRLVTDPVWRSVVADSPLVALGRVLVGMP